eukprot:Hpha_TRINITY_DN16300_c2_g1::TRINITY_DN16300_c2_g1_i3::g.60549::m.60549
MGLCARVVKLGLRPGESPEERARKELMMPVAFIGCFLFIPMFLALVSRLPTQWPETTSLTWRLAALANRSATGILSVSVITLFVSVVRTKSLTILKCEIVVLVGLVALALLDLSFMLLKMGTSLPLVVLILDLLLLVDARPGIATNVVRTVVVWSMFRSAYIVETLKDDAADGNDFKTLDAIWFYYFFIFLAVNCSVLVLDFITTRGFATNMRHQQSVVTAAVNCSELATVHLSKYRIEEARAVLASADSDLLPGPLRDALEQLVRNLAAYRPYLPQSCFAESSTREDSSEGEFDVDSTREQDHLAQDGERRGSNATSDVSEPVSVLSGSSRGSKNSMPARGSGSNESSVILVAAVPKKKRLTLMSTNRKGLLTAAEEMGVGWLRSTIAEGVDAFAAAVADQRGVVDLISGDHNFASFGGARMCMSPRLGAVKAAAVVTCGDRKATACVCSGTVVAGDFGGQEQRRYMAVGELHSFLLVFERLAAVIDGTPLVDKHTQEDSELRSHFHTRLHSIGTYTKHHSAVAFKAWVVTAPRKEDKRGPEEWMYELQRQGDTHAAFNTAMKHWINGAFDDALSTVDTALGEGGETHPDTSRLHAMRKSLAEGQLFTPILLREGGAIDPVITITTPLQRVSDAASTQMWRQRHSSAS